MDYGKNPESTQKEIPQKSKTLKLSSLPPKVQTNCPIVEVEVCETGPTELPDLFTIQLLTDQVHRNRSSVFFC
jgi:hypothetical protein